MTASTAEKPAPAAAAPRNAMELIARMVEQCRACPLHQTRQQAVPGAGPPDAKIMLIAEGPGKHEDRQGLPFVGPSGKFLDKLLDQAGLSRPQIFITNIIKCRAPNNRDPAPEEISACRHHLERQIIQLEPELIIPLGKFAIQKFLPGQPMNRVTGRLHNIDGRFIYPIMHPAAGLRRGDFAEQITQHFRNIPEVRRQRRENPPPPATPPPPKAGAAPPQSALF